jgi:hypothetical protein
MSDSACIDFAYARLFGWKSRQMISRYAAYTADARERGRAMR